MLITVFTPSFNRAHLLPRLYKSLCAQTCKDFIWMIIDDGSKDNTKELVQRWQDDGHLNIEYYYKENGGMHTAHNYAYERISTELNVCIDSDDWMPESAIEIILRTWNNLADKEHIAGLVGLDAEASGNVIGTHFPGEYYVGDYNDLFYGIKISGDKKFVLRTDVVRKFPAYPEYKGERLVPLGTLYMLIGSQMKYHCINEVLCTVEYQPDGSSNTIVRQYFQSPKGFIYAKKLKMKYAPSLTEIVKSALHIAMLSYVIRNWASPLKGNRFWWLTIMLYPLGYLLYLYFKFKIKK